jgi:UDP-N-acetylglucosamine 1-carboxyvinyltransferase
VSEILKQAGELLKQTRLAKGLTQQELGEKLGLNRSTINRYENGTQNLTLDTLQRVMGAMGEKIKLTKT